MSENIRVYHDEESGKLVGLNEQGEKVPIEYESINADELNNAAWPEKYGAVGDGTTDDHQAIQDALDNESVVSLKPKTTYRINSPAQITTDDTTFLIPNSSSLVGDVDEMDKSTLVEVGGPNNSASNVHVKGSGVLDAESAEAANGSPTNHGNQGGVITLHDTRNCSVRGLTIKNARQYGICISLSKDLLIDNVHLDKGGDEIIDISDGSSKLYVETSQSVSKNIVIRDCSAIDHDGHGFEVDDGPSNVYWVNCTVESETVTPLAGFSVHAHVGDYFPSNIYYINCTAKGSYDNGYGFDLNLTDNSNQGIAENYVYRDCHTDSTGLIVRGDYPASNITIDNCTLSDGPEHGIYTHIGDSSNITIKNNTVRNFVDRGVFVWDRVGGAVIEDVSIINNTVSAIGDFGILAFLTSTDSLIRGLNVSENEAQDADRTGIHIQAQTGQTIRSGSVSKNRSHGNNLGGGTNVDDKSGIMLKGEVYDLTVSDNVCWGQPFGIGHTGSVDHNIYHGNQLRDNSESGFGGTAGTNSVKSANIT